MTRLRVPVFISFNYDHDPHLVNLLVGQARNEDLSLSIEDMSLKAAFLDSVDDVQSRIRRAFQVIVL